MIDKQQLQAMGEHQAEQHMCMAKQIEDLQARLQECAKGAAKMQEQRDKLTAQLKDATAQCVVMAGLLREADSVVSEAMQFFTDRSAAYKIEVIQLLRERIDAALAGQLPDHVACAGKMVEPLAWRNTGHPNGLKRFLTQKQYEAQTPGVQQWFEPIAINVPDGWQLVPVDPTMAMISAATAATTGFGTRAQWDAMLAAAPKLEQTK